MPPLRDYGAERQVWTEKMLASLQAGLKGKKWFSLIDKVSRLDVLQLAWAKVQSNAGACGVDGTTIERFAKDSPKRLLAVKEQIENGVYQPQPVKRVWIPKLGSPEKRPLGIPTVRDRVVQTALRMVIEPIFEREFAEHSYGFRSGRSGHDALRQVESLLRRGHVHVVDLDIKGYFDAIPHERLLQRVSEHLADGRVLELIRAFLEQEVLEGPQLTKSASGTPQGGVISPLLANLYLNPLDWLLSAAGLEAVRYADDLLVLCKDRTQAEQALERVRCWMEEAGLELHPEKTRLIDLREEGSYCDFLGYRFQITRRGKLLRLVRPKSREKLRERLRVLTRRTCGQSLEAIIRQLNVILRGWYGYFRQANRGVLAQIDRRLRERLRAILRRRQKKKRRQSEYANHRQWPNCYFARLGLFSLEAAKVEERASLRRGATC